MTAYRSKWTSTMAEGLGWHPQHLRRWLKDRGYGVPYDDPIRALRLLKEDGHDISACLKFLQMRAEDILPNPAGPQSSTQPPPQSPTQAPMPSENALTLTQPPSSPPFRPPVTNGGFQPPPPKSLLVRLARASPGGHSKDNQEYIRRVLNEHNFDLRSRDEARALEIMHQAGIPLQNFISLDNVITHAHQRADLSTLNPTQLRELVNDMMGEIRRKDAEVTRLKLLLGKGTSLLNMAKERIVEEIRAGRDDFSGGEIAALAAHRALENGGGPEDV